MNNSTNTHMAGTAPAFGWSAIFAGAMIAASLFFVFLTFGSAIGLGTTSSSASWRDASYALSLLSGLYLLISAIACFAIGGYVVGRVRSGVSRFPTDSDFHAGIRGLLTWGVTIIFGSLLSLAAVQGLRTSQAATGPTSGSSAVGESLIGYELDKLFRTEHRPADADMSYPRSEAARILLNGSGHAGVPNEDRTYLSTLVRSMTGLATPDAERRADQAIVRSRDAISRARKVSIILGFMTAASLLLGAVVSWFASELGERDGQGLDESQISAWFEKRSIQVTEKNYPRNAGDLKPDE